ncbi:MAG: hypothetical protein O3B87_00725 [bacterium]|nr:hypothetical protein [bacterium]
MDTLPVGEFKSQFADILSHIRLGKGYIVTYGKKKEKVAVVIPYDRYISHKKPYKLGLLESKGEVIFHEDFKMSDEELLGL